MKKSIILILLVFLSIPVFAVDGSYGIPLGSKWVFKPFSLDHLYPTYLADPLGVRAETAAQFMIYSDLDYADPVNDGDYLGRLSIYPGIRLSLFQFTQKESGFGIEGEIGFMAPVYMRAGNNDVIGMDGIYYFRVNSRIFPWLNVNLSKHHICTHIGDEYASDEVESPVDFDPNRMQLPVLDDFRFAVNIRPLFFLKKPELDILALYGEIAWFTPGGDFLGTRINKPNGWAYMNFLAGAELEYYFPGWGKYIGGVFAAVNVSWYQQNGMSANLSFNTGWILPQDRNARRLRVGFHYYNGRSLMNQFYDRREVHYGIYLAADV